MVAQSNSGFPIPSGQWNKLILQFNFSPQQARIVEFVLLNRGDKQIAASMGLKVPTVRTYLQRIYTRVGVQGRMALALKLLAICLQDQNRTCHLTK